VVVVDHVVEVVGVVGVDDVDVTTAVCCDVATVVPFLLVAVTVTRIVEPLSPARTRYTWPVAAIGVQFEPSGAQRAHWYA
jgi:hypothetical protein